MTQRRGAIRRFVPSDLALSRAGALAVALGAFRPVVRSFGARVALLLVGSVLIAVGVATMLWTGLGPGPLDVFITSIVERWGVPITFVVWGVAAFMVAVAAMLGHRAGPGTLVLPFVSGAVLPVAMGFLDRFEPPAGITVGGVTAHVLAVGVVGLGAGAVIVAGLGAGTGELLATAASDRVGRPEPLVRTGVELSWLVFGIVLGGAFGVGTLIVAVLIGPAVRAGHRAVAHGVRQVGRRPAPAITPARSPEVAAHGGGGQW